MFDSKAFVNSVVAKWCAKYPTQAEIIVRGAMILLSDKVSPRSAESWRVEGAKGATYLVEVRCGYHRCDCPAFEFRKEGQRCKHAWATALYLRLQAELAHELAPIADAYHFESVPTKPAKKTERSEVRTEGRAIAKLPTPEENQKRLEQVVPCPVISIRKGDRR